MGLVDLITKTLGWVRDELGGDRKAIAVADRGIGNSPSLIREIEGLEMFYLMRVTRKVRVMMEDGEVSPFDELSDAPGKSWRRRARAFKKSDRIERSGRSARGTATARSHGIRRRTARRRKTEWFFDIRRPKSEDGRHSDFYDEKGAPRAAKTRL